MLADFEWLTQCSKGMDNAILEMPCCLVHPSVGGMDSSQCQKIDTCLSQTLAGFSPHRSFLMRSLSHPGFLASATALAV
ncbi:hypothetical protein, partial [Rhodoferax sp.]|uniref:hypothetical protein n=1 Tax=Rhodoferax sp. TaxID=50421 RepID=UPI00260CFB0A